MKWAIQLWQAIPLKLVIALTVAGIAAKEQYPLSHYPMYSNFDGHNFYLHFADENGNPIPTKLAGTTPAKLKKKYLSYLKPVAKKLGVRESEVPDEIITEIAEKTLNSYLPEIQNRSQWPNYLTQMGAIKNIVLVRVDLQARDSEPMTKTMTNLGQITFSAVHP